MTTKKLLEPGSLLREFRKALDMSPREFGRLLGVGPWLVKGVEEGAVRVSRAVLERVLGLIETVPWMQDLVEGDVAGSLRVASVPQVPAGARTVVVIGPLGVCKAYLDMPVERAIESYKAFHPDVEVDKDAVVEIRLPESSLCECCGRPLPGEESVNRLIVVKGSGLRRACFLNVSRKEAIERYVYTHQKEATGDIFVEEIEFDDEFDASGMVEAAWRVGKQQASIVEEPEEE
jgi:hypothetical protein